MRKRDLARAEQKKKKKSDNKQHCLTLQDYSEYLDPNCCLQWCGNQRNYGKGKLRRDVNNLEAVLECQTVKVLTHRLLPHAKSRTRERPLQNKRFSLRRWFFSHTVKSKKSYHVFRLDRTRKLPMILIKYTVKHERK